MSKPLGMTAMFKIVEPTEAQDKIYDAVEAAIREGCTVQRFIAEARECWVLVLDEQRKTAMATFDAEREG